MQHLLIFFPESGDSLLSEVIIAQLEFNLHSVPVGDASVSSSNQHSEMKKPVVFCDAWLCGLQSPPNKVLTNELLVYKRNRRHKSRIRTVFITPESYASHLPDPCPATMLPPVSNKKISYRIQGNLQEASQLSITENASSVKLFILSVFKNQINNKSAHTVGYLITN